jgi:hypothetical protein
MHKVKDYQFIHYCRRIPSHFSEYPRNADGLTEEDYTQWEVDKSNFI